MKKIISNATLDLINSEYRCGQVHYHESDDYVEIWSQYFGSVESECIKQSVLISECSEKNHVISKTLSLPEVQLTTCAPVFNNTDRWMKSKKEVLLKHYCSFFNEIEGKTSLSFVKKEHFSYDSRSVWYAENRVLVSEQDIKWFYHFDSMGGFPASAFGVIIMEYYKSQNDFERIDMIISELDAADLSSRSLVSILRSTYAFRNLLKAWDAFYEDSYNSMLKKGLDPAKKLRGLKPVGKKEGVVYGSAI